MFHEKKGDKCLSLTSTHIVIQRKNGEVDFIPYQFEGNLITISEDSKVTIGYGDGTVKATCSDFIYETF